MARRTEATSLGRTSRNCSNARIFASRVAGGGACIFALGAAIFGAYAKRNDAGMFWACVQKAVARVCLGRAQVGGARISWMRAREMHAFLGACKLGCVYLLGARMFWIVLLHKEM